MHSFGQILREAISAKKLTLKAVAKSIGTQKGYISGICNRKISPPSAKMIERLCKVLELDAQNMIARAVVEKMPKGLSYVAVQDVLVEAINAGKILAAGPPKG